MAQKTVRRAVIERRVVLDKLTAAINEIARRIPIDCAYLYGSYAYGHPKAYSDVDVAVVSPMFGKDIVRETVFLMECFEKTGLMVEPRAYSREEYLAAEPGTFLYNEVIQKGIRLL